MFKKLVTNLPYSPGLLNQIGFYTKRLKQEEFTRRLGIVFAVLALVLNANLAFFGPEASVLASPANDVIVGGIHGTTARTIQDKAIAAMNSSSATAAIFDYYGITETDIRGTTLTTLNTANDSYRSVGRQSFGRGGEICRTHNGQYFCERSMHAAYRYKTYNVRAIVGVRQSKTNVSDRWFALLESCGNVVIRTGNDEDIKVNKQLGPNQASEVEVGDNVLYRVRISSQNNNGAKSPVISDTLPEHTSYVDHTPKDLFDKASVNGRTLTLSGTRGELGPNETRVIDVTLKVLASAPDGSQLCNVVSATSLEDSAVGSDKPCVTINNPPPPTPEPECVALRLIGGSSTDLERTFEAEVKADGATIHQYDFEFGDGQSSTVKSEKSKVSTKHTYDDPGSYSVEVSVQTSEGTVGGSSPCVKTVVVEEVEPVVACDYFNLLSSSGSRYEFEAGGSANGTTITEFEFNFGDGNSSQAANDGNNKASAEHEYSEAGSYTATATAIGADGSRSQSPACQLQVEVEAETCPYDETLSADDENCEKPVTPTGNANIVQRKQASNLTQEIDNAHGTKASPGDTIEYRLITENDGNATETDYVIKETLGDVLQYANVVDLDGGTLEDDSKIVSWPAVDVPAGEQVIKTITVKVMSPLPNTPVSTSDALAYDLRMENAYGNNVTIDLPASTAKRVETAAKELPNTGPGLNVAVSTMFFGAVTYFYSRNRLITKELGMIKQEFSGGS